MHKMPATRQGDVKARNSESPEGNSEPEKPTDSDEQVDLDGDNDQEVEDEEVEYEEVENMDTSNPAAFVNAQLLPNFIGKKVRAVVQVNRSDGGITTAKSTDESQLTLKGLPQIPPMNYVEVIGIAETSNSIRAEIWTDFGATFDANAYNQLCQLANGEFRSLFL